MPLYGAPGERIAYAVHDGPEGAPPILLVHGFTASSASFMANVEGLRQHFQVITTDLLGHGDSDAPDDPAAYGPEAAIARLGGLLDHLGHYRTMIAGHSLGGALALRFALAMPERVAGLVVINSSTAALTPELFEAAQPRYARLAERAREEGLGFMEESDLNPAFSRWLPDDARTALVRDFQRLTPAGFAGTTEGLTATVNAWDRIPELEAPTLVVIGDRDSGFMRVAPAFLERLPAGLASWVVLEGAGHAANLSAPEAFNAAVIDFATSIGYLAGPAAAAIAAAAPPRRSGVNTGLTALGSMLIVAGFTMLGAAYLFRGGDDPGEASFIPFGETTPTPFSDIAGERTPGPGLLSTPSLPVTSQVSSPTAITTTPPAATPQPSPTLAPTQAQQPTAAAPTATSPAPATPTPGATRTEDPSPSPTAAGPAVFLAGPAQVAFGEQGFFQASATIDPLRWEWSGCNQGLTPSSCSRIFDAFACQSITATAIFPDGTTLSTTRLVQVGDITCQ